MQCCFSRAMFKLSKVNVHIVLYTPSRDFDWADLWWDFKIALSDTSCLLCGYLGIVVGTNLWTLLWLIHAQVCSSLFYFHSFRPSTCTPTKGDVYVAVLNRNSILFHWALYCWRAGDCTCMVHVLWQNMNTSSVLHAQAYPTMIKHLPSYNSTIIWLPLSLYQYTG